MDKINWFDVRKECRLCGRRYPADSNQRHCECGGYLYIIGAYLQRQVKGDTCDSRGVKSDLLR